MPIPSTLAVIIEPPNDPAYFESEMSFGVSSKVAFSTIA